MLTNSINIIKILVTKPNSGHPHRYSGIFMPIINFHIAESLYTARYGERPCLDVVKDSAFFIFDKTKQEVYHGHINS